MARGIDEIDKKIIELISERSRLYIEELKEKGIDVDAYSPEEKSRIIDLVKEINDGTISNHIYEKIFTEILTGSISRVAPVKIAFLGPEGTFSHIALHEFFGESVIELPQATIPDVFREVEKGHAHYGVVPVENSTEGGVTYTMDELVETNLNIISEKFISIHFGLLSRSSDTSSIKKIYSHPQPLGQCKGWIRMNLPDAEVHRVDSTSRAAEIASRENGSAAIASEKAADLYNLNVLAAHIEDARQNYTRFFLMGRRTNKPTGKDKTSIVCAIRDKPGALLELLQPLSEMGINMTKIESRPDKKKMWQYNFFIDLQGHREDRVIKDALEKIRDETIFLKILGSYPVGN